MLPFTREVFLRVLEQYNAAVWPAQVVAYALGVVVVLLAFRPRKGGDRFIAAALAGAWIWTGVVYHAMHFAAIDWAAWAFGAAFAIQGLLLAWSGALRGRIAFRFAANLYGWVGLGLVTFAMAAYPLIGLPTGYGWPRAPMLGVAPGPTVIFTLGMLLLTEHRVPPHLLAIPVLWSLVGTAAAWLLGVPQDLALLPAGIAGAWLALLKNRRLYTKGH